MNWTVILACVLLASVASYEQKYFRPGRKAPFLLQRRAVELEDDLPEIEPFDMQEQPEIFEGENLAEIMDLGHLIFGMGISSLPINQFPSEIPQPYPYYGPDGPYILVEEWCVN